MKLSNRKDHMKTMVLLALAIFAADETMKLLAEQDRLPVNLRKKGHPLILRKSHNYGAAMNALEKHPDLVKKISAGFTAATVVGLVASNLQQNPLRQVGFAALLGGAVSNLTDRMARGYVVDYLSLNVPADRVRDVAFNIGDVSIALGAILITASVED